LQATGATYDARAHPAGSRRASSDVTAGESNPVLGAGAHGGARESNPLAQTSRRYHHAATLQR